MRIEPDAPIEAAPHVLRLRLVGAVSAGVQPDELAFSEGALTQRNLQDLAAGFPSEALTERIRTATVFSDGDDLVVIPHEPLLPMEHYSVGVGRLDLALELRSAPPTDPPLVAIWPIGPAPIAPVYCGSSPLSELALVATLDPGALSGTFVRGTPRGNALSCLRFEAFDVVDSGRFHPPPNVDRLALDPRPLDAVPADIPDEETCLTNEIRLSLGCARIEDDRAVIRGPQTPVMWVIAHTEGEVIAVTQDQSELVVRGMLPSAAVAWTVETLSTDGVWRSEALTVHTEPARARPVMNEVYANAIGPEPDQEWIELINDGLAPWVLDGWVIEDIGGQTVLPSGSGVLEPGGLALVVPTAFDGSGLYDVAPSTGARVIRVDKLGKNGLSNDGEPLRLVDPQGVVASTFPSKPKPKAGQSVARTLSHAADDDPASFFVAETATPGSFNVAPTTRLRR